MIKPTTLDILVTHYKEPWQTCKFLFDSIAIQRGVDFDNISVVMVNDGHDGIIHGAHLKGYPFKIKYLEMSHGGVSAARNFALDNSSADYVMFCDCDDGFMNAYALHTIFASFKDYPDAVVSSFLEEQWLADGTFKLIRHETNDSTFIHGKVYRREFLNKMDIRFNESLTIHEDGFFNLLALVSADRKVPINSTLYVWKWNDNSTVRRDPNLYVMKTYDHLMRCREAICDELDSRGFVTEYIDSVAKTIMDSYYDFNKPEYLDPANAKLVKEAKKSFRRFYVKYKRTFDEAAVSRKAEIAYISRTNAYQNGLVMESVTLKGFLQSILKEVY